MGVSALKQFRERRHHAWSPQLPGFEVTITGHEPMLSMAGTAEYECSNDRATVEFVGREKIELARRDARFRGSPRLT